jgi:PAS domain S-box-containing protein
MDPRSESLGELVVRHLATIAAGRCSITEDEIRRCEATQDRTRAEILTGLFYLHQDLVYREGQRAQALENLKEKEEFARSLLQVASDAIVTADSSGDIVSWNSGAEAMFGYGSAEVVGKPLWILMPERYRESHRRGLDRLRETGKSRILGKTLELDGQRKGGEEFPIELRIDSWKTHGGRFFTGIIRDITERKRREEMIQKLIQELEAFSYSVSHDLRGPLRAIDGYSRILQEDHAGQLTEEGRRLFTKVREAARRMGQLIDDLLEFSRMGRTAMHVAQVDMTDLALQVINGQVAESPMRKFEVRVGSLPPVWGDRSLLKQVFINLLGNAVKYTRPREVATIEVGGSPGDKENTYWVKDNGVGFDMQFAHKLFGVFQRLHTSDEFEGTGVGLALVQRIVSRHGGRVWAEGVKDQGATLSFTLPKEGGEERGRI